MSNNSQAVLVFNDAFIPWYKHTEEIYPKKDMFKPVFTIMMHWHISTGILKMISRYPCQNICEKDPIYYDCNDQFIYVVCEAKYFVTHPYVCQALDVLVMSLIV